MIHLVRKALDYFTQMSVLGWGAEQSHPDGSGTNDSNGTWAREYETPRNTVLQYLRERERPVYQSQVAEDIDWSEAKVSRVLSELEDAGTIARHRVGRNKVITFPEDESDVVGSIQH